MHLRNCALILAILAASAAQAGPAPFDLAGPILDVKVTRGTQTLPASRSPESRRRRPSLDQGRLAGDANRPTT